MKICIVSILNIKHISLISHYTSIFKKYGIDYDIIYIDKYNEDEQIGAQNKYIYKIDIKRKDNKPKKIWKYLGFIEFSKKVIKENDYDYLIIWRTETAFLLWNFLVWQYKGKYILNIRDYFFEKNILMRFLLKKLISKSVLNTISSEGFKSFLPKEEYTLLHSYNNSLLESLESKKSMRNKDEPLRICFIGYVRFFENDKKLLNELANDKRYILQYFGAGSEVLEQYCLERNITNVEFYGKFNVEYTAELLRKADVINNLYGYNDVSLDTAISIKYYYAIHMNVPILVFKNTYMEKKSKESGLGFIVNEDFKGLGDDFFEWYHSKAFSDFQIKSKLEKEKISAINNEFETKLINIIQKKQ